MYVDKDSSGRFSIMGINPDEMKDIATIFFEFEHANTFLTEKEKSRLGELSSTLRKKIIALIDES